MSELFLKIIIMSISASWLVLAVLILRLVLKKAPKWMNVLLWGVVAIRLICPFTIESPISMIPDSVGSGELISEWMNDYIGDVDIHHPNSVHYDAAIGAGRKPISDGEGGYYIVTKHDQLDEPATNKNTVLPVLSVVWVTGITILALYTVISFWRLRRKVNEAVIFRENIYLSENVCSPFVLGMIKPKIYLPFKIDDQNLEHIIAHEQAHIRRKDHWWKPFGFLLLTIHWFNPLMWIAYILLCRDVELACDEKVIKKLGSEQRADYTQALLACSVNQHKIAACPLAFGEIGIKERVKNVLNYKKTAFWVIVATVIACAVVMVCFATSPVSAKNYIRLQSTHSTPPAAFYSLNFAEKELQRTVIAERWENGRCVSTNPIFMNNLAQQIQLYLDPQENGVNVQLGIDNGETILENFSYPEGEQPVGWSFVSLEEGKKEPLQSGTNQIIAVMTFDFGAGVKSYSCEALSASKEQIENAAYMIVIRAFITNSWESNFSTLPIENRSLQIAELREKYPEYFDLGTFKGLEVYVWQMAENDYRFGLMQGTNREKIPDEKMALKGATAEEMALILSTFNIEDKDIFVIPWPNPISSYMITEDMAKDPEYINHIRAMLGLDSISVGSTGGTDTPIAVEPEAAAITLSEEQAAIRQAIMAHNKSSNSQEYDVACCSFITLETFSSTPLAGSSTRKITFYGWALYEEYKVTDNSLKTVSGSHIPVAISFNLDEQGYTLTEYWEPRDGSYYAQDIREKFPAHIAEEGMDNQKFILQQTQECYAQAVASTGLDTNQVIGRLIETICGSPVLSPNPGDYIEEHPIEYRELTYYGRFTLKYCFAEFLKGGQTDLRGHIMRAAIDDIAPEAQLKLYAETGQEYFDAWKDAATSLRKQHDTQWIEMHQPAIYLLLQMIDE